MLFVPQLACLGTLCINSNILITHIFLFLVIPTKVDTSQVKMLTRCQQWRPWKTQPDSENSFVPSLLVSKHYLPIWMWSVLTGYDQKFFRPNVWEFPNIIFSLFKKPSKWYLMMNNILFNTSYYLATLQMYCKANGKTTYLLFYLATYIL